MFQSSFPETGGDIRTDAFSRMAMLYHIHALIGLRRVERTSFADVGSDLDIIKGSPHLVLNILASGIERDAYPMGGPHIVRKTDKGLTVIPLSEEKEAIDTEVVLKKGVYALFRQFGPGILPQMRRMTAATTPLAIADTDRERQFVRNLFDHNGRHVGDVFDHEAQFYFLSWA